MFPLGRRGRVGDPRDVGTTKLGRMLQSKAVEGTAPLIPMPLSEDLMTYIVDRDMHAVIAK